MLGCKFEKHRHGSGPEHYSHEVDGVVFEIYPKHERDESTLGTRIGFQVKSIDTAIKLIVDSGRGKVISQPKNSPWGRRAVIDDPDGHRVELLEKNDSLENEK